MHKGKFVLALVLLVLPLSGGGSLAFAEDPDHIRPMIVLNPSPRPDPPQPLWWGRVYADHWEFPIEGLRPHVLAVWTLPYCHQQQYHGPGGYADTCSSSHGCIDQWTWWLRYPQSKLGVPSSWWSSLFHPERRNIRNYSALCWIQ